MAKASAPEIVALSTAQLEELLAKLAELVPVETYRLLESVLRTFQWLVGAMEANNTTLGRLRRMIFGKQTEKTSAVLPQGAAKGSDGATKTKAKGHGRKAAQDYSGAQSVKVAHPLHRIGELCPKCLKGKLYRLRVPARLVRIVAQPIFQATHFELERLRCALCGALLTAPSPPEAGLNKGRWGQSMGSDRRKIRRFILRHYSSNRPCVSSVLALVMNLWRLGRVTAT